MSISHSPWKQLHQGDCSSSMHFLSSGQFLFRSREVWEPCKSCLPNLCEGIDLRDSRDGFGWQRECALPSVTAGNVTDQGLRWRALKFVALRPKLPTGCSQSMTECGKVQGKWRGTSLTGNLYQEFTDNLTKPSLELHCSLVLLTNYPKSHKNFME